jgi:hypothetical protein
MTQESTAVFELEAPETDGISMEMTELLEGMATRAQEGDIIGEAGDIKVKAAKQKSLVSYNGVELPARTRVYDRFGVPSDVPTAQLGYHLGKRQPDGQRAFFARPPAGATRAEPIDQNCEWCDRRAGRVGVKKFYHLDDYEAHCEFLHPREWASKMRRESKGDAIANVSDIIKLLAALTPEQKAALVGGS